jgi:hypothetical protein
MTVLGIALLVALGFLIFAVGALVGGFLVGLAVVEATTPDPPPVDAGAPSAHVRTFRAA